MTFQNRSVYLPISTALPAGLASARAITSNTLTMDKFTVPFGKETWYTEHITIIQTVMEQHRFA